MLPDRVQHRCGDIALERRRRRRVKNNFSIASLARKGHFTPRGSCGLQVGTRRCLNMGDEIVLTI